MRSVLDQCLRAADGDARLRWAPTAFLEAQGVEPWSDLPLWVPAGSEFAGAAAVNVDRAVAAGLHSRPLADTVEATLAWFIADRGLADPLRAGMSPEREREILALLAQSRDADAA
jgi:2'-hydroxyisoflavone reductase